MEKELTCYPRGKRRPKRNREKKTRGDRTKQNKTKQNKTKQNKTKQNKQNKKGARVLRQVRCGTGRMLGMVSPLGNADSEESGVADGAVPRFVVGQLRGTALGGAEGDTLGACEKA
jgi:septum formation inhibitor MinC